MRRSYLRLLGGVLFSLPLLFASCGNGDNALEEIIKNGGSGGSGEGGGSSTINATAITLSQTMKVIKLGGDALTITATVTPSDATYTWESSDEAIATVENGVVTPVGKGIATITAKSGDVKATCEVFVGKVVNLSTKTENYTVAEYDILIGALNSSNSITIPDNCKVAFAGVTTASSITCSGNATIILVDGNENTVSAAANEAGIKIGGDGTTLTINAETLGNGILNVTGGSYGGAGIGTAATGVSNSVGGDITINGGKITATGNLGGAGIGTGYARGGYTNKCGKITIKGGEVTATGGTNGAGIGTGYADGDAGTTKNECGDITINGGTVIAKGDQNAAGIGTGCAFKNTGGTAVEQKCGAIMITADVTSVTAIRGASCYVSIGTGNLNGTGSQSCGTITIDPSANVVY